MEYRDAFASLTLFTQSSQSWFCFRISYQHPKQYSLIHPAHQVVFGLQSALGVVIAVISQTLHEFLLEGFALSCNDTAKDVPHTRQLGRAIASEVILFRSWMMLTCRHSVLSFGNVSQVSYTYIRRPTYRYHDKA